MFALCEYEIFIASGTNIKYMETTCTDKDWQAYINNIRTKATGLDTRPAHKRLEIDTL